MTSYKYFGEGSRSKIRLTSCQECDAGLRLGEFESEERIGSGSGLGLPLTRVAMRVT